MKEIYWRFLWNDYYFFFWGFVILVFFFYQMIQMAIVNALWSTMSLVFMQTILVAVLACEWYDFQTWKERCSNPPN